MCPATIQNTAESTAYFPCHMNSVIQNNSDQEQTCPQTGHCQFCQIVAISIDIPTLLTPQPMVKITRTLPYFYHFIAPLPQRPPRFIA